MLNHNKLIKFSKEKKVIPKNPLRDLTPVLISCAEDGVIFTGTTLYLGRYQNAHPYFSLSGSAAPVTKGLKTLFSTSTTTGLYVTFVPVKAKIRATFENLDASACQAMIVEVPNQMYSTFVTNYAEDLKLVCSKMDTLSKAGVAGSVKTLELVSDLCELNGMSLQQMLAEANFQCTYSALGSSKSSFYYQFKKLDGSVFTVGVACNIVIEYVCYPKQVNVTLGE